MTSALKYSQITVNDVDEALERHEVARGGRGECGFDEVVTRHVHRVRPIHLGSDCCRVAPLGREPRQTQLGWRPQSW